MGEMSCRTCGCTDFNRRGDQLICDACGRAYPAETAHDEEKGKQSFAEKSAAELRSTAK